MWLMAIAMAAVLTLSGPASASAPTLSHKWSEPDITVQVPPEKMVELAIATVTTNKKEALCAKKIAWKESRYAVDALNKSSGARGVWQLMWGKPGWSIFKQTSEAHRYVLHRYKSWCGAMRFHQERNWY